MNKIVVRYADGRTFKGYTNDFFPNKPVFHAQPLNAPPGLKLVEISIHDLKAVFFVKDFAGHPEHKKQKEFDPAHPLAGRKLKVIFKDEEIMVGTTQGYQPDRPGFFMVPADAAGNNERCFIVMAATKKIEFP